MIGRSLSADGGWRAPAAVALALAIGVAGWLWIRSAREPGARDIRRARVAHVDLLEPRGILAEAPSRFAWKPVASAASYEVRIADDDMVWPLFVRETSTSLLLLEPREARALAPGRTHIWEVEARSPGGAAIATGSARFRVGAVTTDAP